MSVIIKQLLFLLVMLLSTVKGESDQIESGGGRGSRLTLPPIEKLGPITKWISDPPPLGPMKPTLQDKYHRRCHPEDSNYPDYCGNLEALRVEDRSNTFDYRPNIDLMAQNCMGLNYHWPAEITLPSITMSLSPDNNVDIQIQNLRMTAPSGCIVVLVGGKFVKRMDDIVRKVDYLTSQLALKFVTYFAEKTDFMPLVDLDNSPAVVGD